MTDFEDIDDFLDRENSYETYEKNEHLYKENRDSNQREVLINKTSNTMEFTPDQIKNNLEKEILDIKEVENPMDKYIENIGIENSNENLLDDEPISIVIKNSDGTEKTIVLGEKEISKEKLIEQQLIELKEYINSNKDSINSVEVKKGSKYHKKIPLKDFINKELNTTNYSSNPEKLGEDIILSLLKPLKVFNNYMAQNRLEKNSQTNKPGDEKLYTLGINGQEYQFKKYSEDYKNIIIKDKDGKEFEIVNDKNINFIIGPDKAFNNTELDLLNKGKSLIQSSDIPFKVSNQNGTIKFQTITNDDYIKNIDVKSQQVKSNKQSNKLNQNF